MNFEIRFLPGAEDDLKRIPSRDAERIILKVVEKLSAAPFPKGKTIKRIIGVQPPLSRLRVGDWRVFFEVEGQTVWVLAVARKPKAARAIKKLRH